MLPIEKLQAVKTIVCHGPTCADGMASAMLLKDALYDNDPEILFSQYGKQQAAIEIKPNMLFCDFSPDKERLDDLVASGAIVLDHHKWTKDIVAAFGDNGVFADEKDDPGVSGAVLAFREVWLPLMGDVREGQTKRAQEFAELAGVYDTWQTGDERWYQGRVQERAIRSFRPKELLSKQHPFCDDSDSMRWWDGKLDIGKVLVDKLDAQVEGALKGAYRYNTSKGTRVIIFQDVSLTSMAAEVVDDAADLIVGFSYKIEEDNQALMMISTRSHTGYNCMEFAGQFGGGGHTAAAGFTHTWEIKVGERDPYSVVKAFVQSHET